MRRLLITLQSFEFGGMETFCLDLMTELVRRRYEVAAVVPQEPLFDGLAASMRQAGVIVERIDSDARRGRLAELRALWQFARFVRKLRPDVIHLHTGGATGGLAVVTVARLTSLAVVVVTEHDVPDADPALYQRITRFVMDRLMDTLVAVSRRNAALRDERLSVRARRFASILNGVPVKEMDECERARQRRRIREQLGLRDDAIVIGTVVRLAPGKGLHDLLNAFALLRRQAECELVLVGDGVLRSDLETAASALQIASHVHFAGYQADPAPYFAALDIFVLPVPAGSMSIALLEAMAAGLPSVITFCGPEEAVVPEVTGLSAPPSDPEGLCQSLLRLVCDPELRMRLGAAAAIHVRTHFSIGRVAADLLEIYEAGRQGTLPDRLQAMLPPITLPDAGQPA